MPAYDPTQFSNPTLRAEHAPQIREIEAQRRRQQKEAERAQAEQERQQKEAQRQQEQTTREQAAAAEEQRREQLRQRNDALEKQYRAEGRPFYVDAHQTLQPEQDDAAWNQQREQERARADQEVRFKKEGRKYTTNEFTKELVPLESDADLAARRQAENEKLRRDSLTREMQAAAAQAGLAQVLPAADRTKAEKALKNTRQTAAFALQSKLAPLTSQTDKAGWWDVVNNNPTETATKAKTRLERLLQPDADLDDEDLADLEGDPATQPLAAQLKVLRGTLVSDDEARSTRQQAAQKLAELRLLRDDPSGWEKLQQEKIASLQGPELEAHIAALDEDLQTRGSALQQRAAELQAPALALQQQEQEILARNEAAKQQGIPVGESFTAPDGQPWHRQLYGEYARHQAIKNAQAPDLDQQHRSLEVEEAELQRRAALRAAAAAKHQADQEQARQTRRNLQRFTPGMEATAAGLDALEAEAQTRAEALQSAHPEGVPAAAAAALNQDLNTKAEVLNAQGQQRQVAAQAAYAGIKQQLAANPDLRAQGGDLENQAAANLAEALEIPPQEAMNLLLDAEAHDWSTLQGYRGESGSEPLRPWSTEQRTHRFLSNGGLVMHPRLYLDPEAYVSAVQATAASPEAQAAAIAALPELRRAFGAQALETFRTYPASGFEGWKKQQTAADKTFGSLDERDQSVAYADHLRKTNGTFSHILDQVLRRSATGVMGLGTITLGSLAGVTGSETLAKGAVAIDRHAGSWRAMNQLTGADDALGNRMLGQLVEMVPSAVASYAGGRAAQSGLRVMAATPMGFRLLAAMSAGLRAATTPAAQVKAMQGLLTTAGLVGAGAAGGAQTYGSTIADVYGSLRDQGFHHTQALAGAQTPALLSAAATAILTFAGGATGVEKLLANPGAARQIIGKRFQAIAGAFAKEGLKEFPEEVLDEAFNTVMAEKAKRPDAKVGDILADFAETLPELAASVFLLGGAGGAISKARETSPQPSPTTADPAERDQPLPSAPVLGPHQLPETVAAAHAAIDDYATARPDLPPEQVAATQDVARVLLAVAQGEADSLPNNELALVGLGRSAKDGALENAKTPDGTPPRVRVEGGQPIIQQDALDRLEQELPAVRAAIGMDEVTARQHFKSLEQGTEQGAGSVESESEVGTPARPGLAAPAAGSLPQAPGSMPASPDPAAAQRSQELATHLQDLGLPQDQASAAAAAIVARRGVRDDTYLGNITDPTFREDLAALGISGSLSSRATAQNPLKAAADFPARLATFSGAPSTTNAPPSPSENNSKPPPTTANAGAASPNPAAPGSPGLDADAYLTARRAALTATPPARRAAAVNLLGALDKALTRYAPAFTGVKFVTQKQGGGLSVERDSKGGIFLEVDLRRWADQHSALGSKAGAAALAEVEEEFIHRAAVSVLTDAEVAAFTRALPRPLLDHVWKGYHAADIANKTLPVESPAKLTDTQAVILGHEFLRMLVQDSQFRGRVSEAVAADPGLGEKMLAFLQRLVSELRRLIAQAPQDTRVTIAEYEARVTKAVQALRKTLPANPLTAKEEAPGLTTAADARRSVVTERSEPSEALAKDGQQTAFAPVTGASGTAYTDANDAIEYQWAVVEAGSLNVSNADNGKINPAYPQELQPRDRTSAGSEAQVADIARNMNLERLSASNGVGDGAPIVGPDGVVESGNGRVMGMRRGYSTSASAAKLYAARLASTAGTYGLTPEQVQSLRHPVLVRVRTTPVDRVAFVLAANVSTIAPKREIEQAKADAKQIVPDLFSQFVPSEDGEIFTQANADFIRAFIATIVPPAERPAVIDARGNLSQTGLRRIRNALFVHAYGDSAETLNALARLTESLGSSTGVGGTGGANIINALLAIAPRFAEQMAREKAGALYPLSITADLAQTVQTLQDLRNKGEKVADFLAQDRIPGIGDDPTPLQKRLLQFFDANAARPRQLLETLARYAAAVDGAGDPKQATLFGETRPTREELWDLAAKSSPQSPSAAPRLPTSAKTAPEQARQFSRIPNITTPREAVLDALASVDGGFIPRSIQAAPDSKARAAAAKEQLRYAGSLAGSTTWEGTEKGLHIQIGESETTLPWSAVAAIAIEGPQPSADLFTPPVNPANPVNPVKKGPELPPQAALKLYRRLKALEAQKGSLEGTQAQTLERAERALGQLFLFDQAPRRISPAFRLESQETSGSDAFNPQSEQLRLFSSSKAARNQNLNLQDLLTPGQQDTKTAVPSTAVPPLGGAGVSLPTSTKSAPPPPPFYSKLESLIAAKMPARAPAAAVRGLITNPQNGIKQEELKWSGILTWLEAHPTAGKEALLAYLRTDGAVIITEQRLAEAEKDDRTAAPRPLTAAENERLEELGTLDPSEMTPRLQAEYERLFDRWAATEADGEEAPLTGTAQHPPQRPAPKYGQYQLPGGTHYREIVLTLPARPEPTAGYYISKIGEYFGVYDGRQGIGQFETMEEAQSFLRQKLGPNLSKQNFTSDHFPEVPNYLAHYRANDRTDTSGQPGLFLEELQSDRHQQGREKGYANPARLEEIRARLREIQKENGIAGTDVDGLVQLQEENAEYEALAREGQAIPQVDAIPDAPFRKDWPLHLFKRALADAVSTGKAWIGWTTGDTQADRYDLSQQIQGIDYWKSDRRDLPGQRYGLTVRDNTSKVIFSTAIATEGELAETIGKELAQRVVDSAKLQEKTTLSGLDLKVGGEGMKAFYDRILPNEISKYVKQWAGKVRRDGVVNRSIAAAKPTEARWKSYGEWEVRFTNDSIINVLGQDAETEAEAMAGAEEIMAARERASGFKPQTTPIWRVDITPDMRAGVQAGQTLFTSSKKSSSVRPELSQDPGSLNTNGEPELSRISTNSEPQTSSPVNPANPVNPVQKEGAPPPQLDYNAPDDTAPDTRGRGGRLDSRTARPTRITGGRVAAESGQALRDDHFARLLAGGLRRGSPAARPNWDWSPGPDLARRLAAAFGAPVLTPEQEAAIRALPLNDNGVESTVYLDRAHGVIYKRLKNWAENPSGGIWPQVTWSGGRLAWHYQPADNPRATGVRLAVMADFGGTPTEVAAIGREGHLYLKQPLSPDPQLERVEAAAQRLQSLAVVDSGFPDSNPAPNSPAPENNRQQLQTTANAREAGLNAALAAGGLVPIPARLIAPSKGPAWVGVVRGRPWLVTDLAPDNFIGDNQGAARVNDPVIGVISPALIRAVPGLASVVNKAGQQAAQLGDRSARLFTSGKRMEQGAWSMESDPMPQAPRPMPAPPAPSLFPPAPERAPSGKPPPSTANNSKQPPTSPARESLPLSEARERLENLAESPADTDYWPADLAATAQARLDHLENSPATPQPWYPPAIAAKARRFQEIEALAGEMTDAQEAEYQNLDSDLIDWSQTPAAEAAALAGLLPQVRARAAATTAAIESTPTLKWNPKTRTFDETDPTVLYTSGKSTADNRQQPPTTANGGSAAPSPKPQAPNFLADNLGWNHLDKKLTAKVGAHVRWAKDTTLATTGQVLDAATDTVVNWLYPASAGNAPAAKIATKFLTAKGKSLQRALFPDSILPRELTAALREMGIKTSMGTQRSMDLVRALSDKAKFSDLVYPKDFAKNLHHRKQLWLAMAQQIPMSSLPPELQALATRLRGWLVEIGREAVKQGRMSADTFALLQEGYMPHYYQEDVKLERSLFARWRLGIKDILAQRSTAWHIVDSSQKDSTGEDRLVSWNKNQWRFRNAEHRDAFYEDFILQEALSEIQGRNRKTRTLTLADLRAPAALDAETRGRLKEIQRTLRTRYQRRRPLTLDEKEKAGLIMDPVYAIARYAAQMVHDNSVAAVFNYVAATPAWVSNIQTPGFTEIPDNPRFGRLAGKFVLDDVAGQILELVEAPSGALKFYDTVLAWWKTGKTVLNAPTHCRNVLGNLFFSQLAGCSLWNPGNWSHYKESLRILRNGGPALTEAYEAGVLGADFVGRELREVLRQILPDPKTVESAEPEKVPGLIMGIGKSVGRALQNVVGNSAHFLFNKVTALYQAEDEVFKLAAYLKAKAMGMDAAQATRHVRQWFPYFDKGTSGTLKALGRTAFPFLSFYRESVRIFGEAVSNRPIALLAGLSIPSLVTFLSAMAHGLDDEELEEVRKDMRGKAGKLLGPTPFEGMPLFSMLLPPALSGGEGNLVQVDLSAIHPFVDFLGNRVEATSGQDWYQQMWRSMLAAGPIGSLIYSQMTGRDTFGDRTFVENNMTPSEKVRARLGSAIATLAPPITPGLWRGADNQPIISGGTAWESLRKMGERTTNKTFETRSPTQTVLRSLLGVDARNATPDLYRLAEDWRRENGYEVSETGVTYGGGTPASRARKALFGVLAQDEPNLQAVANITRRLKEMGHPVETPQQIQQLFYYSNPLMIIGPNKARGISAQEAQAAFRADLPPVGRRALEKSIAEHQKIKQRAPLLLRQAQLLPR